MDPRLTNYPRAGYSPGGAPNAMFGGRPPGAHFEFISEAFTIIRSDMGTWVATSLLTLIISYAISIPLSFGTNLVTSGSLMGPSTPGEAFVPAAIALQIISTAFTYAVTLLLLVGQGMMGLRAARGERVQVTELFAAFRHFVPVFLVSLVVSFLVMLGLVFCIVPGVVAAGLFVLAPFAAYEQQLSPGDAMRWSFETCKPYFWGIAWVGFCASFVSGLGVLLCCVGYLVTAPIFGIVLGLTYGTFRNPAPAPFMPYPPSGPVSAPGAPGAPSYPNPPYTGPTAPAPPSESGYGTTPPPAGPPTTPPSSEGPSGTPPPPPPSG